MLDGTKFKIIIRRDVLLRQKKVLINKNKISDILAKITIKLMLVEEFYFKKR